jgi:5-methylcytosine-specific restriction endonuclease McrA
LRRVQAQLKREGTNVCWLCGQPIDLRLPYLHPLAWTLDHVIPLSLGGHPLDMYNLREAHRRCNSSRGNRPPVTPQRNSRAW